VTRRGAPRLAAALPALVLAALLAGCATPPRGAGQPVWTSGRISVRIDATASQPASSVSAAFEITGDGESGEMRLSSPLGIRMATARWSPGLAALAMSDGDHRYASLDELSRVALGEALPLAALPDWLAGRPWSGAPHRQADAGFEQLGWQVLLGRRAEGWIEARRDSPPAVLVRIRLDEAA
jgi:outer membrane lipoprotein LolB